MYEQITIETKKDAFMQRPTDRRKAIIKCLEENGQMTAREVANVLGFTERNAAAPRLTELVKAGRVQVVGKKPDTVTGRTTAVYELI